MKIDKLTILWTSGDVDTATKMILRYTLKSNANKWWQECNLITWGPSNKLLCENPEVEATLKEIMATGVKVYACLKCAEEYNLVKNLQDMGIEVKLMGEPFTEYLQDSSYRVITI